MVNYKLSYLDSKNFKEIIWNKGKYANYNNHSLKDIDDFTMHFSTHFELKQELVNIGALDEEAMKKSVAIRYIKKGKITLLPYELPLKDDAFFFNPEYIKSYLKTAKHDIFLLDKLCNHYRNSYVNGINIHNIREYLIKFLNQEIEQKDVDKYYKTIDDFVDREVYSYDSALGVYEVDEDGNRKIRYKNLHGLAMFLAYDLKKRIDPSIHGKQKESPKVKTKGSKKDQIPGQYSLFD